MKYYFVMVVLAAVLAAGCVGSSGGVVVNEPQMAYNAGCIAVYAAYRAEVVTRLELEAARPYLVMMRDCLEAEPADVSIVLADFAAAQGEAWGVGLEGEDLRIAIDLLVNLFASLQMEEPSIEAEKSAALAVRTLEGMLHAIDLLLG